MAQPLYGFLDLEHLFDERVTEVGVSVVDTAIQQSLDEHNRQLDALMALFAEPTTDFKVKFKTATQTRSQALDQDGRPRPIQVSGEYEVAFPIQGSGNAWGANYLTRAKMTIAEANRITSALLEGDKRWVRDHILAALFADGAGAGYAWQFDDPEQGSLDIKGLADGDTDVYQVVVGADAPATDDHYKAQLNAISDTDDPFGDDKTELIEHPENAGAEIVCLLPTNLKASIKGLSDFHPVADDNIERGSGSDVLVGSLDIALPGEIFGYHDEGVWLVEWPSLPSSYYIMVAAGAEEKPLKMRQHGESELQGFFKASEGQDWPFWQAYYYRWAGFGAWNRVGALVRRIGNAAYAVPTNFGSPMP